VDIKSSNLTDTKISKLKSQVDGVVVDMKANIERVVDRGTSLIELSDRSEQLGVTADHFNKRSRGLKRTMYFRTFRQRMYLLLTIGFIFFLILCKNCFFSSNLLNLFN
jgi:hypothetical protein